MKVSRDGSSPSKKEPATQPRYLLLPSPALQNNEYCLVVLLKWNGHLVHFNSRQGKAAVQDSKPIRLSLPFSYQQDGEYIRLDSEEEDTIFKSEPCSP